ncbi:hypothetical protein ACH5RR_041783 [Cinchona calisaya]|uniref:Uncharacterized protein n=1 Tax=Cinchona calisaya TaxID=153742 RepID=A0ABD2XWA5_9GENT
MLLQPEMLLPPENIPEGGKHEVVPTSVTGEGSLQGGGGPTTGKMLGECGDQFLKPSSVSVPPAHSLKTSFSTVSELSLTYEPDEIFELTSARVLYKKLQRPFK